ncbi:MAG: hypothetical protein ACLUKQ_07900 [Peptococcaceae bacterium]
MFTTMEIVAYILILVSAVFKGLALMNLNNKSREFSISKKKYSQWNLLCYLFLIPGVLLWAYCTFVL